jgi:histone acetyltransferase
MVICRNSMIIGGICYRPYPEQRFGEIAFCAISGTEQVRGYGTLLMNNLKCYAQQESKSEFILISHGGITVVFNADLEYFLTYADNYAIGYFQKQGFSKTVVMPKER